jgi:hypothetical protein
VAGRTQKSGLSTENPKIRHNPPRLGALRIAAAALRIPRSGITHRGWAHSEERPQLRTPKIGNKPDVTGVRHNSTWLGALRRVVTSQISTGSSIIHLGWARTEESNCQYIIGVRHYLPWLGALRIAAAALRIPRSGITHRGWAHSEERP